MQGKLIDISLELDARNFHMRTPAGFKRDMQFEVEVIKDFDAAGGAGQIVRGVHMRLHAGSHVDAPEHFVKGGKQIHELPLETFYGPAVVADVRHRMPGGGITGGDLEKAAGAGLAERRSACCFAPIATSTTTARWNGRSARRI